MKTIFILGWTILLNVWYFATLKTTNLPNIKDAFFETQVLMSYAVTSQVNASCFKDFQICDLGPQKQL